MTATGMMTEEKRRDGRENVLLPGSVLAQVSWTLSISWLAVMAAGAAHQVGL